MLNLSNFKKKNVAVPVLMAATTQIGAIVESIWENELYGIIKDVGGVLAIATFVCSGFYYTILGPAAGKDTGKAKTVMIGAIICIAIIYLGPTIVGIFINMFQSVG